MWYSCIGGISGSLAGRIYYNRLGKYESDSFIALSSAWNMLQMLGGLLFNIIK